MQGPSTSLRYAQAERRGSLLSQECPNLPWSDLVATRSAPACPREGTDRYSLSGCFGHRISTKGQAVTIPIDHYARMFRDLAGEQFAPEIGFNLTLQQPL